MFVDMIRPYVQSSSTKVFKRGEIIYNEGDEPENLYLLEDGLVGLFHITESGHESFLRVYSKSQIFGHRSYLAQELYHASAIALTETKVTLVSKSECNRICLTSPDLILNVARILAKELRASEIRMSDLQDKSANARIVESIVFLKLKKPDYVWTRKEIAEFSGSTLETVTRVITLLAKANLIEKNGRDFVIFDHEQTLEYARTNF